MDSAVNPQPDDPNIRIAHSIYREMIKRNFSKRQQDIIKFILTLSWGCSKPSAIIPKLKQFELCGIGKNHIKDVLGSLCDANVIFWNQEINVFQINKHFDCWEIDIVGAYDEKMMKELIHLNITEGSPNLSKKVPKMGTKFPNKEPSKVPEKGTEFPKEEPREVPEKGTEFPNRELESSQIRNLKVPKKGTRKFDNPLRIKRFQTSKASIKASIKTIKKKIDDDIGAKRYSDYESFYTAHKRIFGFACNDYQSRDLSVFIDQDGLEEKLIIHALERAALHGKGYNFKFITTILTNYFKAKAFTVEEAKAIDAVFDSPKATGGKSGKPQIQIVAESKGSNAVSPEELEELLKLARKLDGKTTAAM